jgi:hypothetical protein
MYVPPLNALLRGLGLTRADLESVQVTIPIELLKLLLQVVLANSEFNEVGYLRANPDIAGAFKVGSIENTFLHYVGFGYFEGRLGATPEVNEAWYLRTYSDVAAAVRAKQIASAKEHFEVIGAGEGRSPNAESASVAAQWKKAIGPR